MLFGKHGMVPTILAAEQQSSMALGTYVSVAAHWRTCMDTPESLLEVLQLLNYTPARQICLCPSPPVTDAIAA